MIRKFQGAAAGLCILWLSGCASIPRATPTGLTPAGFWKDQGERRNQTESLSAKLRLSYRARSERISGKGRLLAQKPDQLRIELRDPLGRVQYIVALDGKGFAALVPSQKRLYVDSQGGEAYLKHFLGLDLEFRALQSLFVGALPDGLRGEKLGSWEWSDDKGAYVGTILRPAGVITLLVDGRSAALRELRWERRSDTVRVVYSDFVDCCTDGSTMKLGYAVAVSLEKAGSEVVVDWDDVAPMGERKSPEVFRVSAPEGIKKIRLP